MNNNSEFFFFFKWNLGSLEVTIHKTKKAEHNKTWELEVLDWLQYLTYIFLTPSMISVVISNKTHMQKKHRTPTVACTDLNRKTDEKENTAQREFAQPAASPR